MFLYLLITINILGMEEIKVSYPKGRVDFSFYQNLEEDKYKGKYVDLFDFLNKHKNGMYGMRTSCYVAAKAGRKGLSKLS